MKKCSLLLSSLLVSLFFVTACQHSGNKKNEIDDSLKPEVVSTDEAKAIIEENKGNENFVLLDVRTNAEFKEGYLVGHMPEPEDEVTDEDIEKEGDAARFRKYRGVLQHDLYAPDFDSWLLTLSKEKRYLLYCRTQVRSEQAFKKLKAAGFKKIQYMYGGSTQWGNEDKPMKHPPYVKALDVLIKGDKIKTKGNIKFDFLVSNLEFDPARKGKISLKVMSLQSGAEVVTKEAETGNDGKATYIFERGSNPNGKYRLLCTATHKYKEKKNNKEVEHDYIPHTAYYDFEIADEDVAATGSATEITIEDDIKAPIAERFYNRNVFFYKAYDSKKKVVTLQEKVDASKPTLLIFFSPLCPGCMTKAQDLVKYKLDSITVIPIITSVGEDTLDHDITFTEDKLKNKYGLGVLVPHELYDCKDEIFDTRFRFKSTPKFVLINKEGQVKDIVYGSEKLKIETLLKKMETKFGLPAFQKN